LADKGFGGRGGFVFRVRVGDFEFEVCGSREEVLRTVEDLPGLVGSVREAFEVLRPRSVATLTVKADAGKKEEAVVAQKYPKIVATDKCDEALLRVLGTDWGKWRPRTMGELGDVLRANELEFSGRVMAGVLSGLVRKGVVRRWKTDAGFVYILAEKENLAK